ncbi:conserved hypothetical protein [Candidatus Methylobacter favarea]|uniref:Uncharacterized protein n=1 Tax=Candidatus Methylobacter favarea TaxID=2707345 RepID=A0A8S0Y695_9GAMM|nr:hypothetical protein [Candidatus Methylobacter favarea]CAA9890793.1 conserved hypothetical protein [Candidatus Methylobacter favarea]
MRTLTTYQAYRMDKNAITQKLRALASDDKHRSKAARLRDVIEDVETALAAGVRRATVVDVLQQNGLDISMATFATTLKRIRKQRGKGVTGKAKLTKPASAPVTPPAEENTEPTVVGSSNPADLDEIIGNTPDLAALAKFGKRSKK